MFGIANVKLYESPEFSVLELSNISATEEFGLIECGAESLLIQLIVSPFLIVNLSGLNAKFFIVTL